ncbi:MAG: Multidrug resistance-associated protein 1 [Paramarteilia canceri]
MAGDFELNFVSMERINELKSAPQEPEWYVKDFDDVLENWPSEGTIHFDKFYLKYRPNLNYALADIDFKIPGGTKVGIVGRTGAGKSTLISALFRTIESSSGAITIDNVNISHIGLQQLRQKLSLIPQDPVIFDNTLRHNLDPEVIAKINF